MESAKNLPESCRADRKTVSAIRCCLFSGIGERTLQGLTGRALPESGDECVLSVFYPSIPGRKHDRRKRKAGRGLSDFLEKNRR